MQIDNRLTSGLDIWLIINYCKMRMRFTFCPSICIWLRVCQVASTLGVFMPRGITELWDFVVFVRVSFSFVPVSVAYLWRTGFKHHDWKNFQSLTGDKMRQNSQKNEGVLKVAMIEDMQPVYFCFFCL